MTIGEKLKELRLGRGLSLGKLGKKSGIHPVALSYYENGERCPSLDNLKRLCKALGRSLGNFEVCEPFRVRVKRKKKIIGLEEFLSFTQHISPQTTSSTSPTRSSPPD